MCRNAFTIFVPDRYPTSFVTQVNHSWRRGEDGAGGNRSNGVLDNNASHTQPLFSDIINPHEWAFRHHASRGASICTRGSRASGAVRSPQPSTKDACETLPVDNPRHAGRHCSHPEFKASRTREIKHKHLPILVDRNHPLPTVEDVLHTHGMRTHPKVGHSAEPNVNLEQVPVPRPAPEVPTRFPLPRTH